MTNIFQRGWNHQSENEFWRKVEPFLYSMVFGMHSSRISLEFACRLCTPSRPQAARNAMIDAQAVMKAGVRNGCSSPSMSHSLWGDFTIDVLSPFPIGWPINRWAFFSPWAKGNDCRWYTVGFCPKQVALQRGTARPSAWLRCRTMRKRESKVRWRGRRPCWPGLGGFLEEIWPEKALKNGDGEKRKGILEAKVREFVNWRWNWL